MQRKIIYSYRTEKVKREIERIEKKQSVKETETERQRKSLESKCEFVLENCKNLSNSPVLNGFIKSCGTEVEFLGRGALVYKYILYI